MIFRSIQLRILKNACIGSRLAKYPDTLCSLGTRMLFLRSFSDFSARRHMKKIRAISHRLSVALCGCHWIFPTLLYSRGLFFDCIKCVSYLTSCNVSGAADATSSNSTQLSLRVLGNFQDYARMQPQHVFCGLEYEKNDISILLGRKHVWLLSGSHWGTWLLKGTSRRDKLLHVCWSHVNLTEPAVFLRAVKPNILSLWISQVEFVTKLHS